MAPLSAPRRPRQGASAPTTSDERPEGNDTVLRKEPCPECGSKDNLVRYADGHAHCFSQSCDHWEPSWGEGGPEDTSGTRPARVAVGLLKPDERGWEALAKRGITTDTMHKMGHFTTGWKGKRVGVRNYHDKSGAVAFQKVKWTDKEGKHFTVLKTEEAHGSLTNAWLYGRHAWGDKNDRKVVIFTGEDDADAAAEVTKFKFPCVSVTTGDQGAVKCLKANYQWLDRFAEIILFFDNDTSGQSIIKDCAELFDGGKVKVAKMEAFKDASEAKQANRPGDIEAAIWSASVWGPKGIVNARDGLAEFLADGLLLPAWPYPWPELQAATLGQRRGEISLHLGGTGIAKTTLLYHYARHLLRWGGDTPAGFSSDTFRPEVFPVKVGWLGFEDTLKSVKIGILSCHMGQRIHITPPPVEVTTKAYIELFGAGQLELYDPESAEWGLEAAMGYIRYMAKALGCAVIFMDPLSFIVASLGAHDRTQAEEKVAAELAHLAKRLNIHLHISHHLKKTDGTPFEEGGEVSLQDGKGSGAWGQFASNIFGYERDQQGSRPDLLRIRKLKVRAMGGTGPIEKLLKYDPQTGRYEPTDDKWPDDDKDGGKGFGVAETPRGESDY